MVIEAIKKALNKMSKEYCTLSQIDYSRLRMSQSAIEGLKKEKYLERPFAYEFYHQLRTLLNNGDVTFGGPIIQAEVDKRYQRCFAKGKIPDFIIHIPNYKNNLAVIEFKLASNLYNLENDFKKLVEFKKNEDLKYAHAIEVIIGSKTSIKQAKSHMFQFNKPEGEEIIIIEFDTNLWKTKYWKIKYYDVRGAA